MPVKLFIFFCLYSVLGWAIDAAWRSLDAGRLKRGGFSRYPFSPIYGFGAVFVLVLAPLIRHWPLLAEWAFFTLTLGAFEYVGGVMTMRFFKRRLWNYTDTKWDLNGHTGPGFAAGWGVLALLLIYYIQPFLERLIENAS